MRKEGYKSLSYIAIFLLFPTTFIHVCCADDADVMAKLAKSVTPSPSSWTGSDFCKWEGLSCDSSESVISIDISSKSLSGTIPSEINQLSGLRSLSLQRNQLSGPVPNLSGLSSLIVVNLDDNGFNSVPSGFLSRLTSLQSFSMNNNVNLPPWTIPNSLKDSSALNSFNVSKSNLFGEIPDIFGSLPSLQILRLSYNNLTGWLPASFAKSGIQQLSLNNQEKGLFGRLDVLGSMTELRQVWLHSNWFSGPIPDLSSCTELSDLGLRDNILTGVIPDSLTKLPKLTSVALQNNKFQGPIPVFPNGVQANLGTANNFCLKTPGPCDPQVTALLEAVGAMNYPMTLADSWQGNNACQQWQFITCDHGSVSVINFGKQNWTGTISPSFAKLTNLKSLILNDNKLEGRIPESLTSLKQLQLLDLTNNNISGKIPKFSDSVKVIVSGNPFIGEDVLDGGADGISSVSRPVIVILVLVFLTAAAIGGFLVYRCCLDKQKESSKSFVKGSGMREQMVLNVDQLKGKAKGTSASGGTSNASPVRSSAQNSDYDISDYDGAKITIPFEVLQEVTDNFSENNEVGRGGFGVVYRGQLQDGTSIAVKRMESSIISDKGLSEFKAEIEVLTKVRHKNLVALHGFCNYGSERLLVYEYMPEGSLGQHLFRWEEMGIPPLTWSQRVITVLDVARGIEYLHSMAQQSFIHRDLKTSNILLGDDMRAKVSDFGLVRSAPDDNNSIETRLAGTFGYLAPEYAATGRVSTKIDVYSFGVVLMEIITGRKALDRSLPDDQTHLVTWFRSRLQDKDVVKAALDPALPSDMDEDEFQNIWKVVELAGHCTAKEPQQRPDMSHVVNVLSSLVDQWKPSPEHEGSFDICIRMSLSQALQKWQASEDQSSTMSGFFTGDTNNQSTLNVSKNTEPSKS